MPQKRPRGEAVCGVWRRRRRPAAKGGANGLAEIGFDGLTVHEEAHSFATTNPHSKTRPLGHVGTSSDEAVVLDDGVMNRSTLNRRSVI